MSGIEFSAVTDLVNNIEKIKDEIPENIRELHEEIANIMETELHAEIPHVTGTLKSYQEKKVGSKGGYAKIRPKPGETPKNKKGRSYAYGYITNAVVRGHKIRGPESSKYYRPRINTYKVLGNDFYGRANTRVQSKAIALADEFLNKLSSKLEG